MSHTLPLLLSFLAFSATTMFTPGPNNMMLLASGMRGGVAQSWPHILGVAVGFALLVLCVTCGLGELLTHYPWLQHALTYGGAAYILYLSYRIATTAIPTRQQEKQGKRGFIEIMLFQWLNPKGWMTALSTYALGYGALAPYPLNAFLIAALFGLVGLASSLFWVKMGHLFHPLTQRPRLFRLVNALMATLLLASLYPLLV